MNHEFDGSPRLFVIYHRPGPTFNPRISPTEQDGVTEHFAYIQQLESAGSILLSGPLLAEGAGGLMVLSPKVDAEEANSIANNDPAVKTGLVIAEVLPWMISAGNVAALIR